MNGQPLTREHGYPARLIVTVDPFQGFYQVERYIMVHRSAPYPGTSSGQYHLPQWRFDRCLSPPRLERFCREESTGCMALHGRAQRRLCG
jgi:hypothetical protein